MNTVAQCNSSKLLLYLTGYLLLLSMALLIVSSIVITVSSILWFAVAVYFGIQSGKRK